MARNEDFDNAFWSMPIVEDLSADATLLYIWSWTNPRCGMAGIYEVGRKAMTESKVTLERIDGALSELANASLAFYVEGVLWIVARVKRLRTKTTQMAKSIAKDLQVLSPDHPLVARWAASYADSSWLRDTLGERLPNLTRTSGEPQRIVGVEPYSVNLTGTSPEVPLTGQGSSTTSDQGSGFVLTRERVDEARLILAARWPDVDEIAVENAAAMYPTVDLAQGCRLAVTWASDPSWKISSVAASLRAALRKLDAEKPVETARARRGKALKSLLASTEPAA